MTTSTMNSPRIQFLAFVLAGLITQPTHAEVIPGHWEIARLRSRSPIWTWKHLSR